MKSYPFYRGLMNIHQMTKVEDFRRLSGDHETFVRDIVEYIPPTDGPDLFSSMRY